MAPSRRDAAWVSLVCKSVPYSKLSPKIRHTVSSPIKSSPIRNASARPLGACWTAYEIVRPTAEPSPSKRSMFGVSCGVEITKTSRIPASIRVDRG